MKLLLVTQAMDLDHPVLGFFHTWTSALAEGVEAIEVICLQEGRHSLPANVTVHSLGKERGDKSRIAYAKAFMSLVWRLRGKYDAAFVHMNEGYCLLAGWLWRLLGKRVALWRNHPIGSWQTHIAGFFADAVCYTSSSAYVAPFTRAHAMPIGIDMASFPLGEPAPQGSILFLGRLDQIKKPDVFLAAMRAIAASNPDAYADVVGDPSRGREPYANALKQEYALANVRYHGSVPNRDTPALYRTHQIFVNLTPAGSFDKTIGEAMASGCICIVSNEALRDAPGAFVLRETTPEAVAEALNEALGLSPDEVAQRALSGRAYVQEHHSLSLLVRRLLPLLTKQVKN